MKIWAAALLLAAAASAQEPSSPSFTEFLDGVRTEALARGIRQEVIDAALADVHEPVPTVIERDRSQAETILSLEKYLSRLLTATLIRNGREAVAKHHVLIDEVSDRYGVPSAIIAGIWGVESNFGRFSGVRPTVAALATLAWDPRRSAFFRRELMAALEILNRGDIEPSRMRGSWAGAMGQVQFMPSSYLQFAEDFDNDGRRDIWSTPADVFASIGNYLKGKGWIAGQPWGREVRVPAEAAARIAASVGRRAGTCQATRDMTVALPIAEWTDLGVTQVNGRALPDEATEAGLLSGATRRFLVYHNYDALLEYNCSHSYAISVAELGRRVTSGASSSPSKAKPRSTASKRNPRPRVRATR